MEIRINGSPHKLEAPVANVATLVESMQLTGKRIAVELNGTIVPRSRHAATLLAEGDRVEIVGAVGGG